MSHFKNTPLFVVMLAFIFSLTACTSKQVIHNDGPTLKKKRNESTQIKANLTPESENEIISEAFTFETNSPELYTVREGDTLWDISSKFLRDPWHWPEIWYKNPQIKNPHLIFPGDQLAIIYIGGQKRVQIVKRGDQQQDAQPNKNPNFENTKGLRVVKITPKVHTQTIDSSIPNIPIDSIRHLLSRPIIIDEKILANSAYILSSKNQHLANSTGDYIYARGIDNNNKQGKFHIFRPNKSIEDPVSNEVFGYESLYLGDAKIVNYGDPATLQIITSVREILRDDRLIPISSSDIERDFFPKPAPDDSLGSVISILDGISQVGQYQTIAINLGRKHELEEGHLVQINKLGNVIGDRSEADPDFLIKLPDERVALALVIKSYEKMSYCLILEATTPVKIGDIVISP